MLEIQIFRNDLAAVAARLATRGYALDTAKFEQLEGKRKNILCCIKRIINKFLETHSHISSSIRRSPL